MYPHAHKYDVKRNTIALKTRFLGYPTRQHVWRLNVEPHLDEDHPK